MGQHTCLGQPYAVWLTMTISSTIINNFDVELSDPEGIMEESPSYKRIRDHIYSFPKHPLKAKIAYLGEEVGARRSLAFRNSMSSVNRGSTGISRISMFVGGNEPNKAKGVMDVMRAVGEEFSSDDEDDDKKKYDE